MRAKLLAAVATVDDLEARIRARLRQVRFERGLTLEHVARRAGLATSTVSRLESGARSLGLGRLARLAAALDTDLPRLVGDPSALAPRPARDGKVWLALGSERPDELRAYKVLLPARLREPALGSHEGYVWLLVLDGRLRLVLQDRDLTLRPGEMTAFNTWLPHWIGVVDEPVELLAVFSPRGDNVRFRDVTGNT